MRRCDNCDGDGGFEASIAARGWPWDDGADGGEGVTCPSCRGSGFVDGDERLITQDEMEEAYG